MARALSDPNGFCWRASLAISDRERRMEFDAAVGFAGKGPVWIFGLLFSPFGRAMAMMSGRCDALELSWMVGEE